MELMSSLLLCTLLAHFPQTLGDLQPLIKDYRNVTTDVRFNTSIGYAEKSEIRNNVVNINGLPFVYSLSGLEYVFIDGLCKKCIFCMESAVKFYKAQKELVKKDDAANTQKNQIGNQYQIKYRPKRNVKSESSSKKSKPKKRSNKSLTLTKYNVDGSVYGLKVKELLEQGSESNGTETSSCRIYSVKKTYSCDSPESKLFLSAAKRKRHKKGKQEKKRGKIAVPMTEKSHFMGFRKRQVDQLEMPENLEFSIEEMY